MSKPKKGVSMAQAWRLTIVLTVCIILSRSAYAVDITTSGCAMAGVEAGCVVLESGGVVYNITAAQPKPEPGTFGTVKGAAAERMSSCQQGTILDPAHWTPDPTRSCPK
jgi:hypothetical protein